MPPRIKPATLKKLQPKLRMITDGDTEVNVIRAERCAGLAVETRRVAADVPIMRGERAVPVKVESLRRRPKPAPLKRVTRAVLANVFLYLRDAAAAGPVINGPSHRQGRIVEAQVPLSQLASIASHEDVAYLEMAEALKAPAPVVTDRRPRAPTADTASRRRRRAASLRRGRADRRHRRAGLRLRASEIFSTIAGGPGLSASGIRAAPSALTRPARVTPTDPRSPTAT